MLLSLLEHHSTGISIERRNPEGNMAIYTHFESLKMQSQDQSSPPIFFFLLSLAALEQKERRKEKCRMLFS